MGGEVIGEEGKGRDEGREELGWTGISQKKRGRRQKIIR